MIYCKSFLIYRCSISSDVTEKHVSIWINLRCSNACRCISTIIYVENDNRRGRITPCQHDASSLGRISKQITCNYGYAVCVHTVTTEQYEQVTKPINYT